MGAISFLSKSRGIKNLLLRIISICSRFGITSRKFDKLLRRFAQATTDLGCVPTFAITAVTLKRNPKVVTELRRKGVEFAVHGYIHTDYGVLPLEEQVRHYHQAIDTFTKCQVLFTGYRAPFLRTNFETTEALRRLGFLYDSSRTVHWDVLDKSKYPVNMWREYERLLDFYRSMKAENYTTLPRLNDGLVEIPVSIPDDEALTERLGVVDAREIGAIWAEILRRTYERGELFTLQLHPERIALYEPALASIVLQAKSYNPPVWVATLSEIAKWWIERNQFTLELYHQSQDRYKVKAICSERATVLLRNCHMDVPVDEWCKGFKSVSARDFTIESQMCPVIGLSRNVSGDVANFLRKEGYIVETGERRSDYAIYLTDLEQFTVADEKPLIEKIEQSEAPLLRYWRWPGQARSAFTVTGDIDAITLIDFGLRILENWKQNKGG
jgi:peptidoglycan/xylan/chitin deacetylase (PgdA/CDA1 family)